MRSLLVLLALAAPALGQEITVKKKSQPQPVVVDVHVVITISVDVTPGPDGPPPPPPPPPPSPPPNPTDPLTQSLIDAATKDGGKFDQFNKLATGFTNCVNVAKSATVASTLQNQLTTTLLNDVGKGTITPSVRTVLEGELKPLNTLLPISQPNKTISDSDRTTLLNLFSKLANACTAAAKNSK